MATKEATKKKGTKSGTKSQIPEKTKRIGNYGKNKGKKYQPRKSNETKFTDSPAISNDPDEFNMNDVNKILDEFKRKQQLKDPEKEKAKAEADPDMIQIMDNDPDADPDDDADPIDPDVDPDDDEDPVDPDVDPDDDEDPIKKVINPELLIMGLEHLSYKLAVTMCANSGRKVPTKQAVAFADWEKEAMTPGCEKIIDTVLGKMLNKPIPALIGVMVFHTLTIVALSSKEEPKPPIV